MIGRLNDQRNRRRRPAISYRVTRLAMLAFGLTIFITSEVPVRAQTTKPKKVYMVTDMDGVDGIFSIELQCDPWMSRRWDESRKLLTGEVNATVKGLYACMKVVRGMWRY
jgi:hypothetical protein